MDLVQQMLQERMKNQTGTGGPPQGGSPNAAVGQMTGVPALGMVDAFTKPISDAVDSTARLPITAMETAGNVLSGMRNLPMPGAAQPGADFKSMLMKQAMGGDAGPNGGPSFDAPKMLGSGPESFGVGNAPMPGSGINGTPGVNDDKWRGIQPDASAPPPPAAGAPPPPAAPSASSSGDLVGGQQSAYDPNIKLHPSASPDAEAKRRAQMRALGGGFGGI